MLKELFTQISKYSGSGCDTRTEFHDLTLDLQTPKVSIEPITLATSIII